MCSKFTQPFSYAGPSEFVTNADSSSVIVGEIDSTEVAAFWTSEGCVRDEWTRCMCRHICLLL